MKKNCPCDNCITKPVCMNKHWELTVSCPLVREFLGVNETGNMSIPELEVFCRSLGLKLKKSEPFGTSYGAAAYYIEQER